MSRSARSPDIPGSSVNCRPSTVDTPLSQSSDRSPASCYRQAAGGIRPAVTARQFGAIQFLSVFCILLSAVCLLSSCAKSPTAPPPPPPPVAPDTTSHDFVWEIDTLGDGNGSILYDVAIINDTTVWAVGEIFKADSIGQLEAESYNLASWNGSEWTLVKVYYPYLGNQFLAPLHCVFALASGDIWVASNQPMHWNGASWITFDVPSSAWSGWANRIWGNSSSNMYMAGDGGAIARFDGSTWTKLTSGTTLDLYDIWGATNALGEREILAVGAKRFHSFDRVLLRIDGAAVTTLADSAISYSLRGVWFHPDKRYLLVGDGIYWKSSLQEQIWAGAPLEITHSYSEAVRGSAVNSIFVVGDYNDVLHFNGFTWRSYPELSRSNDLLLSVAVTPTLMVAVGTGGIVLIGRPLH